MIGSISKIPVKDRQDYLALLGFLLILSQFVDEVLTLQMVWVKRVAVEVGPLMKALEWVDPSAPVLMKILIAPLLLLIHCWSVYYTRPTNWIFGLYSVVGLIYCAILTNNILGWLLLDVFKILP